MDKETLHKVKAFIESQPSGWCECGPATDCITHRLLAWIEQSEKAD